MIDVEKSKNGYESLKYIQSTVKIWWIFKIRQFFMVTVAKALYDI